MKTLSKVLTSFLCISAASSSIAYESLDERLETLEKEMREISAQTPQERLGIDFASARPEVEGQKAFISFDILYWHPKVGGTDYAYSAQIQSRTVTVPGAGSTVVLLPARKGEVKHNDLDWEWGFKVGLGCNVPHDGWDIYGQYTWYNPDSTQSSTKAPPSGLLPLRQFGEIVALKAKSSFEIDYDNLDVEHGRSYFTSAYLSFRPFIGVKTTWLDLYQRITYVASPLNDIVFPGQFDTTGFDFKSKGSSKLWGIGPRVGLNSRWHLGSGFSYFGDVATSILYGYFKTFHHEFFPPHIDVNDANGNLFKIRTKKHLFIPFMQMFTGLEWDGYVNHKNQHIRLKLGYEVQYYWRANQIQQPEDASGTSPTLRVDYEPFSDDVMFYGITGEFRLDF